MTFEEWYDKEGLPKWRAGASVGDLLQAAWDTSRTQTLFDANNTAGDAANEAEKDARRKVALAKYRQGDIETCGHGINEDELDALIKEAQG